MGQDFTSVNTIRPLTETQRRVAALVGTGLNASGVAARLHIATSTVRTHVLDIANLIPNPDRIPPYRLVMLEAAHDRWLATRESAKTA